MVCVLVLAGCSSTDAIEGTLVYSESGTQHVRVVDLRTGVSQLVDGGQFGSVSIAPDAAHVAYEGADWIVKVADRAGTITPVVPGGGCAGHAVWLTNHALVYCASVQGQSGMMLLPDLDGAEPRFVGATPAVSGDGTLVSYVDARGDLVVEALDGGEHRALVPSPDPTAMYPTRGVLSFTPDQRAVLVTDYAMYPPKVLIVALSNGASIAVDDAWAGASPIGEPTFYGAAYFSPDGSEIVLQSTAGLVAVDLATGAKRMLVPFADRVSSGGAVFIDAAHVLWVRLENHTVDDIGRYAVSLHVAGPDPGDDVELDAPGENAFYTSIAVSSAGFIAVPSTALMMSIDGTVLVSNDRSSIDSAIVDIIGLTPDELGVVGVTYGGVVRHVGMDGSTRDLANVGGAADVIGPYAAYTPAYTP